MGRFKVAVIEGDGIGPEVCRAACEVLEKTGKILDMSLNSIKL